MQIQIEPYLQSVDRLPENGQRILAQQDDAHIVVYQAYKPAIADYAVKHQQLGGADFSYNRMSWIKPNFLWMMYRCGWATKEHQERVLALHLRKIDFEAILEQAVFSSYQPDRYESREQWQLQLDTKEVRIQWDPDHDPHGNKLERRAIQLGLKGNALKKLGKEQVLRIEDITDFVKQQHQHVLERKLERLEIPIENIYIPQNRHAVQSVGGE